jgi:hypothetical protein
MPTARGLVWFKDRQGLLRQRRQCVATLVFQQIMRPICFRPRPDRGNNNNPVKTQKIDLYLARRDVVFPEIRDRDAAQACDNALSHPRLKKISRTSLICFISDAQELKESDYSFLQKKKTGQCEPVF